MLINRDIFNRYFCSSFASGSRPASSLPSVALTDFTYRFDCPASFFSLLWCLTNSSLPSISLVALPASSVSSDVWPIVLSPLLLWPTSSISLVALPASSVSSDVWPIVLSPLLLWPTSSISLVALPAPLVPSDVWPIVLSPLSLWLLCQLLQSPLMFDQ